MDPEIGPLETTRTKGIGFGIRLGLTLGILLLATATAKPWALLAPTPSATPPSDSMLSASVQPDASSDASAGPDASAANAQVEVDPICPSPDGWQIVIDDVEFGRSVRTWIVPTAFYMSAQQPPMLTSRDVSTFISTSIHQVAFCAPPTEDGRPPATWSGQLWYLPDPANADAKQLVGSLASSQGEFSAVVHLANGVTGWPAGLYAMQAHVYPATAPLWIPVELDLAPSA